MAQKSTGFTQENPEKGKWVLWFPVGYEVFIRGLEEMDKITIAIAEDQEYTRETLARIVESQEDFALVGYGTKWRRSTSFTTSTQSTDSTFGYADASGRWQGSDASIENE